MQRYSAWRMAIISFLPDELAIPISERLRVANEICKPITDETLEAMAYQAEEAYRKTPPWPLKFGRVVGSTPVSSLIQFNSIENGLNYGLPVTGYERLYHTCPQFTPMTGNGQFDSQTTARQAVRDQQAALNVAAEEQATRQQQPLTEAAPLLPRSPETLQQPILELHSINLQPSQNDRLSHLENTIELMANTLKESMAAVKALSKKGASRESFQPRTRHLSGEASRAKNESHERGESKHFSYSRNISAGRQQQERSRSTSYTAQERMREQSKSPGRQSGSSGYTPERKSRKDDHSAQRARERSLQGRQIYPKMRKGENCSLNYDPLKEKSCFKCGRPGHHEFECFKYERYSPKKCTVCDRLNHFAEDCKELGKLPMKGKELNSMETEKNW
jgi:hypothetical protein